MSRFWAALCCFFLINGCARQEVLLPVISADGIEQVENHSSVWIFFEISGQDTLAVLNKNNKLINTNWIFNIDRRLKMKQVIPHLEEMQRDRNKDSMHKKGGMKSYFSYADTKNERISLVDFPQLNFIESEGPANSGMISNDSICLIPLWLKGERIALGESDFGKDRWSRIAEVLTTCDSTAQAHFQLHYSANLAFEQYLTARAGLVSLGLSLAGDEYVHTLK